MNRIRFAHIVSAHQSGHIEPEPAGYFVNAVAPLHHVALTLRKAQLVSRVQPVRWAKRIPVNQRPRRDPVSLSNPVDGLPRLDQMVARICPSAGRILIASIDNPGRTTATPTGGQQGSGEHQQDGRWQKSCFVDGRAHASGPGFTRDPGKKRDKSDIHHHFTLIARLGPTEPNELLQPALTTNRHHHNATDFQLLQQ